MSSTTTNLKKILGKRASLIFCFLFCRVVTVSMNHILPFYFYIIWVYFGLFLLILYYFLNTSMPILFFFTILVSFVFVLVSFIFLCVVQICNLIYSIRISTKQIESDPIVLDK